ncbi:MAG: nucleotidyltransferase family protein [Spirochaetia bacterium]
MKAVILAAGKGTRLAPYSDIIPKPLMPIEKDNEGRFGTIISRLAQQIRTAGITEAVIAVNYKAGMILEHMGDGSRFGLKISYVFQEELDGNAGAYYRAQHLVENEAVLITDCDNFFDDTVIPLIVKHHYEKKPALTVGTCPVENVKKFAIIKTDKSGKAVDIYEKPKSAEQWGNTAKSGLMVLSPKIAAMDRAIAQTGSGEYTTTEIISHCIRSNEEIQLFNIQGGFHDIGTWPEYIPLFKSML